MAVLGVQCACLQLRFGSPAVWVSGGSMETSCVRACIIYQGVRRWHRSPEDTSVGEIAFKVDSVAALAEI